MRIPIFLSSLPKQENSALSETVRLFDEAASRLGYELFYFDTYGCKLIFEKKKTALLINTKKYTFSSVLVRPAFTGRKIEMTSVVIKQLEMSGARAVNDYTSTVQTKNKIRQLQILSKGGIAIPRTFVVHSSQFTQEIASSIGKFPVVVKSSAGLGGVGVTLVESKRALRSLLDMLTHNADDEESLNGPVIVQEYIRESRGKDIRVFVVGGTIITAMHRIAKQRDEFRSNFSLGGKVNVAELSSAEKKLAIRATEVMGLDIAGVDIIRSNKGPMVLEVNSNPGLKGITQATGVDVAGAILKYMAGLTGKKKKT